MEQSLYSQIFCLSLYSKDYPIKPSTLYHILIGKRTASILFKAHTYQMIKFFSIFPNLKREQYNQMIQGFVAKGWIKANDANEEFYLSEQGKAEVEVYFSEHFYPTNLNQLLNGKATKEFWEKIVFLTQVLSELRYQNKRYLPVNKEWKNQLWVKNWLKNNPLDKQDLAQSFGKEWIHVLKNLDSFAAEIVVSQLTGYEKFGKTITQLASMHKIEALEMAFLLQNAIIQVMDQVVRKKENYPLFYLIYQECIRDPYSNLSQSTRLTANYLDKGLSIENIALKRKLKANTISEHIIELAIIFPDFDISSVIPDSDYQHLVTAFQSNEKISYEELEKDMPQVPFSWYRLIQVERSRTDE
ncbi:helix-turn-helix domain-containing protein [Carnobacterium sp. 17-4]|uniref:helix-turn-helix domain-containing protein n=1 Tax=Carnobacterium sp. (strain 17-4) TaxID=208596 RepID=UPI00059F2BD1|nr:helix-turn-helix domain-containing protein [Carnobacterium sp. 17-4]